jgi:predicted TIM-barrel enzyme
MFRIRTYSFPLGLLVAGAVSQAMAQGASLVTINLFSNPIAAPSGVQAGSPGETFGMRPETVGAVSYFALSSEATRSFRAGGGTAHSVRIALPRSEPVVCSLNQEAGAAGTVVLSGTPVGGGVTGNCNLVIENGRVSGIIDTPSGRYQIVPLGSGNAHAVVQIRTEAFPNEGPTMRR